MLYQAFVDDDDENVLHLLRYYHNPSRWLDNTLPDDALIRDGSLWSNEIKYLNATNTDISDEIRAIPNDAGGIYIFYIKGLNLSFIENHILYIGRSRYTNRHNIRARAMSYFYKFKNNRETRAKIKKMFRLWQNHLYYRYYTSTDNSFIDKTEEVLIRAILPPMNEKIPDKVEVQQKVPAF